MSRLTAAVFAVLAVAAASAASAADAPKPKAELARTAGKVLKVQARIKPSADGPVFHEGRLTLLDKADHTEEFKATPRTKVTLDGKPAKFQKAAAPGALVLKALFDPATKELASLDLKSGPKPDADDPSASDAVRGEIANTDVLKGVLSVRTAAKTVVEFIVPDSAKIRREAGGKLGEAVPLEALQVGDSVEVHSADGKTAAEIHARAAR
jgi:hypothetical protein